MSEWKENQGTYLAEYTALGNKAFANIKDAKIAALSLKSDGMFPCSVTTVFRMSRSRSGSKRGTRP